MLGARIRVMRWRKEWTQTRLAKELGMSRTSICGMERGYRRVTAYDLMRLAEILGVKYEYLIHGSM